MSDDRIISESWAIICEDGKIAKYNGWELCHFDSRAKARSYVRGYRGALQGTNRCASFRVARVRVVEVRDE